VEPVSEHPTIPTEVLAKLLARPTNERAFMLLPGGLSDGRVPRPHIARKPLGDILVEL
jgi:iodotyrosine deiodinase